MNKYLTIFLILLSSQFLFAQETFQTPYLTLEDTVYITVGGLQDKIAVHKVEPKQTLYSIARYYGLDIGVLLSYNPELSSSLNIGDVVKIPLPNSSIIRYKNGSDFYSKHIPVCYVVSDDETLYRISRKYFKMPVDTIKLRNNLYSNVIQKGQILHIGWFNIGGITKKQKISPIEYVNPENLAFKEKYESAKQSRKEVENKGVAVWQKNSADSKIYALHRKAPRGSYIAVTNPMNKRTIYARVLGDIPRTMYGRDVVTVISPKVANMLGAKDARFFVVVKHLK